LLLEMPAFVLRAPWQHFAQLAPHPGWPVNDWSINTSPAMGDGSQLGRSVSGQGFGHPKRRDNNVGYLILNRAFQMSCHGAPCRKLDLSLNWPSISLFGLQLQADLRSQWIVIHDSGTLAAKSPRSGGRHFIHG
jgi:hypothetical protein